MNRRSRFKLLFTALCVGWCVLFLRCETTEKSMVRAVYLARTETGTQVLLWYQAPEASADASEASAAVQMHCWQTTSSWCLRANAGAPQPG